MVTEIWIMLLEDCVIYLLREKFWGVKNLILAG